MKPSAPLEDRESIGDRAIHLPETRLPARQFIFPPLENQGVPELTRKVINAQSIDSLADDVESYWDLKGWDAHPFPSFLFPYRSIPVTGEGINGGTAGGDQE